MRRTNKSGPAAVLDAAAARAWVLRALARREHSADELCSRLVARGCEPQIAAEVIERLAADGWQSDTRFAQARVRSRLNRGYGPLRAQADLLRAGVEADIRSAALQPGDEAGDPTGDSTGDDVWVSQARAVRERRFGPLPENAEQWQRQYRFLAARGFSPAQIRAALSNPPTDENASLP